MHKMCHRCPIGWQCPSEAGVSQVKLEGTIIRYPLYTSSVPVPLCPTHGCSTCAKQTRSVSALVIRQQGRAPTAQQSTVIHRLLATQPLNTTTFACSCATTICIFCTKFLSDAPCTVYLRNGIDGSSLPCCIICRLALVRCAGGTIYQCSAEDICQ